MTDNVNKFSIASNAVANKANGAGYKKGIAAVKPPRGELFLHKFLSQ